LPEESPLPFATSLPGRTLYLCGAGNSEGVRLALTVNRQAPQWDRVLLLDDDPSKVGGRLCGVEIAGSFDLLGRADPVADRIANLVARTTRGRLAAGERASSFGIPHAPLIDPGVNTLGVELRDSDTIVYQNVTLGPQVVIEPGSVVFMGAVIGHESIVGPGCVIAANAVINARVTLGKGVYVGANATVLPEVEIGEWATIGAGSVVLQNVPAGTTVMGVPASVISPPSSDRSGQSDGNGAPVGSSARPRDAAALEQAIAGIWASVLGVGRVGLEENFFDLGGTSLLALRAHERISEVVGEGLSCTDLFRYTTVRALAGHLQRQVPTLTTDRGMERARLRRTVMQQRRSPL